MWNDANKDILEILDFLDKRCMFPVKCPVCGERSAHVYMYRWKQGRQGSVWAWCNNCLISAHERIDLPDWWKNAIVIDDNLLGVHPDMLNENRQFVDEYVNMLLGGKYPDEMMQQKLKDRYNSYK